MNALKAIFLIGIGIAVGALTTVSLYHGKTKPGFSPSLTKEANPPVERDERELNDGLLTDVELAHKNAERDKAEQSRQKKRYWENPDDPSILRNLDRKDREFWGSTPGHR